MIQDGDIINIDVTVYLNVSLLRLISTITCLFIASTFLFKPVFVMHQERENGMRCLLEAINMMM